VCSILLFTDHHPDQSRSFEPHATRTTPSFYRKVVRTKSGMRSQAAFKIALHSSDIQGVTLSHVGSAADATPLART
jgi:hypothetical protein